MLEYSRWNIRIFNRSVPFSGAIILIGTIVVSILSIPTGLNLWGVLRISGILVAYIILALYSEDPKGLGEMFDEVWSIYNNKLLTDAERLEGIKNFIGAAVTRWDKYWRMFDELTNGGIPIKTRIGQLKEYCRRIYKGEINVVQMIWIYAYLVYSLLITLDHYPLDPILDIIVSIGILIILLFTSGRIRGIAKLMTEVFKTLKVKNENEINKHLRLLESLIINAARNYYFIHAKTDEILTKENLKEIKDYEQLTTKIYEAGING